MNELQKTSNKKVEQAKQAVSSIQGFEMTEFENGKRDLTFNEYLIVNHYESQKRQVEENLQNESYKLGDLFYQFRFMSNYLNLLSLYSKNGRNFEDLMRLHGVLFQDGALSNIEEMIQIAIEKINEVSSLLIDGGISESEVNAND